MLCTVHATPPSFSLLRLNCFSPLPLKALVAAALAWRFKADDSGFGGLREAACGAAMESVFAEEIWPNSGAQALARPGEDFEAAFEASETRLLACQTLGHRPWRFSHNILCVVTLCDDIRLVRDIALPFYLEAVGIQIPAETIAGMLLLPLAHWQDLHVDFVVAGFESGGTTSLVGQLKKTPGIYMMPFELSDWAHDFSTEKGEPPACDQELDGPPSYWPAFMSYAFWPVADTVTRFNDQSKRCADGKLVGVWDSRYVAHKLAVRKIRAMIGNKAHGRVLLCFRDPIRYVVSTFNRISPEAPGGKSFMAFVEGTNRDPDPFGLQLWKGNYSLLTRELVAAVGRGKVLLQPFHCLLTNQVTSLTNILRFLGNTHQPLRELKLPHHNAGPYSPNKPRVDPCSAFDSPALQQLELVFRAEYGRLRRLLHELGQLVPPFVGASRQDWGCG